MPPKQQAPAQSWSTQYNDAQLALTRAKFPPQITPDKQKQKLFIDAYVQTCAQLQIAFLPCFQNLALHPGMPLTQVTVHSAQVDIASSLAVGHALAECTDAQSLVICDCRLTREVVYNLLHFAQRNQQMTLVFDQMELTDAVLEALCDCYAFNKGNIKFLGCKFDFAALFAFLGSEAADVQFLSLLNCVDTGTATAAQLGGCISNIKGIEVFGAQAAFAFDTSLFQAKIPLLQAARQALLRGLQHQEPAKFYTQEYAKLYQKYSQFAQAYCQLVRAGQQRWFFEPTEERLTRDAVYVEFRASAATPDEMLAEYVAMNAAFEDFTGAETAVQAFRKLEYVGTERCPELAGVKFAWDGQGALAEKTEKLEKTERPDRTDSQAAERG